MQVRLRHIVVDIFYKCPADAKHTSDFLWCDEYHSSRGGEIPDYVLNQPYRAEKVVSQVKGANKNTVGDSGGHSKGRTQ